ncbi:hypothetical protein GCM10020295_54370 [Streptomyces cinereospinus]
MGVAGHDGTVVLEDVAALDPAAEGALWRFLFDIDLTTTLTVRGRPVDEAWQYQVSDIRRCRTRLRDGLYVRLVDVGAALEARTYQAPVDVVLEVADDFCPWNAGRWRLSGDAKGAVCARTRDAPDLALSIRELGGGVPRRGEPGGAGGGRAGAGDPGRGAGRGGGGVRQCRGALAAARVLTGGPGQARWQAGHQKRLRAARPAVRISPPQMWQGRPARR